MIKLNVLLESQTYKKVILYPGKHKTSKAEWLKYGTQLIDNLSKSNIISAKNIQFFDSFKTDPRNVSGMRIELEVPSNQEPIVYKLADLFYFNKTYNGLWHNY